MENTNDTIIQVVALARSIGWKAWTEQVGSETEFCFERDLPGIRKFRFNVPVDFGVRSNVAQSVQRFMDGFDVNPDFWHLSEGQRELAEEQMAKLWGKLSQSDDTDGRQAGEVETGVTREVTVRLTVDLRVRVKDGNPALSAEDIENVLSDMDYSFTPCEEHVATGVVFDENRTEIINWEYTV